MPFTIVAEHHRHHRVPGHTQLIVRDGETGDVWKILLDSTTRTGTVYCPFAVPWGGDPSEEKVKGE